MPLMDLVTKEYAVIVCETIRDEYTFAAEKTGCHFETHWVESGLHNCPHKLRAAIQHELDSLSSKDRVILCFGYCGNAVFGLRTRDFELVQAKTDDCISLLLSPECMHYRANAAEASYFLTAGWLRGERNIYAEYVNAIEKHGFLRGRRAMSAMLDGYRNLLLLDTGSFDLSVAINESEMIAEKLGLRFRVVSGTINYIAELLTGPYPCDRFLVTPPNSLVTDN